MDVQATWTVHFGKPRWCRNARGQSDQVPCWTRGSPHERRPARDTRRATALPPAVPATLAAIALAAVGRAATATTTLSVAAGVETRLSWPSLPDSGHPRRGRRWRGGSAQKQAQHQLPAQQTPARRSPTAAADSRLSPTEEGCALSTPRVVQASHDPQPRAPPRPPAGARSPTRPARARRCVAATPGARPRRS